MSLFTLQRSPHLVTDLYLAIETVTSCQYKSTAIS